MLCSKCICVGVEKKERAREGEVIFFNDVWRSAKVKVCVAVPYAYML